VRIVRKRATHQCAVSGSLCLLFRPIIKSATGASGLTATAQGGEGVGEEESRSDARSQLESEGSEPPPFFLIYMVLLCNVFFDSRGRGSLRISKIQGSQTYKNHLVVRTPLYRHTTIIAHEFSPNKSQRRNCTDALHHLEVWPPSKGLCLPSESP
jgi:hypothetical protein